MNADDGESKGSERTETKKREIGVPIIEKRALLVFYQLVKDRAALVEKESGAECCLD
jgi:hypothetical protein